MSEKVTHTLKGDYEWTCERRTSPDGRERFDVTCPGFYEIDEPWQETYIKLLKFQEEVERAVNSFLDIAVYNRPPDEPKKKAKKSG